MSLRFILLLVIVALNGFFAAAEVALVSVRRSRLKELAARGQVSARVALDLLANPERLRPAVLVDEHLPLRRCGLPCRRLGICLRAEANESDADERNSDGARENSHDVTWTTAAAASAISRSLSRVSLTLGRSPSGSVSPVGSLTS